MDELEILRKQVKALEQKISIYENELDKRGFFVLKNLVNQQVEYLAGFKIKDKIGGKASEDATYARTKDLWEGLPKMISDLNSLRRELRITSTDEKNEPIFNNQRTTPESIADVLGNTAGQQD